LIWLLVAAVGHAGGRTAVAATAMGGGGWVISRVGGGGEGGRTPSPPGYIEGAV